MELTSIQRYVLIGVMAFTLALILTIIVRRVIRYVIDKRWEEGNEDVTRLKFLRNSASAIFFTLAIAFLFYEIPTLSHLGTAIFAGAGVLAAIFGFASQKAFSNIVSGVFILLFRPFKVGDTVKVASDTGVIEDITLRHTVIKDYENRRIIIPNSVISDETITNSTIADETILQQIYFGVAYGADLDKAIRIIQDEAMAHPHSFDGRSPEQKADGAPMVVVRVMSWEESSISLRAQVWAAGMDNAFIMKCDLLKSVKERFDKEGVEIPFPYRTVILRKEQDSVGVEIAEDGP